MQWYIHAEIRRVPSYWSVWPDLSMTSEALGIGGLSEAAATVVISNIKGNTIFFMGCFIEISL